MPRPLPTPLLAFAVRELGCVAGVMVTASHNPPQDNGYKVYLATAARSCRPPTPASPRRSPRSARSPTSRAGDRGRGARRRDRRPLPRHRRRARRRRAARPRIVYTPLHGVGGKRWCRCSRPPASTQPRVVVEQQEQPDGDFPTVAFPNPEEPGAMDLAMALAEQPGADLVVANDPDADRCAAAVPGPDGWRMLRGDEVGALLATHLLRQGKQGTYATTIVSSSLLGQDGRRRRPAVRRDAHRLQVDRPRRRAWPSATRRRSATASTPSA